MNKYNIKSNLLNFQKEEKDRKSLKTLEELNIQIDEYSLKNLGKYNLFFKNEEIFMNSILEIYLDAIKKIGALRKNAKQIIGTAFFQGRDFLNEELSKCLEDLKHVKFFSKRKKALEDKKKKIDIRKRSLNQMSKQKKRKQSKHTLMNTQNQKPKDSLYDSKMYEYLKQKDYPLYNYFVNKIGVFSINGKVSIFK
jgi:hypothetical protein